MSCPCASNNRVSTPQEPRVQTCVRTKEYYEQLLIDIAPFSRNDWYSYVKSQINVYDNDCSLFSQFIETNIIPNVY